MVSLTLVEQRESQPSNHVIRHRHRAARYRGVKRLFLQTFLTMVVSRLSNVLLFWPCKVEAVFCRSCFRLVCAWQQRHLSYAAIGHTTHFRGE